jgi:fatty acid desaturase
VKGILRRVAKEVLVMVVMAAIFSALFILGHLALHQTLPRWW